MNSWTRGTASRPADAPHLPPYQSAVLFLGVCAEGIFIIGAGILSAWLWVQTAHFLVINIEVELTEIPKR